jgi:hypothetical protein
MDNPRGLLELRTLDAKTVFSRQIGAPESLLKLDVSTLPSGFYLLSFNKADGFLNRRVLKY